jgi:hypothetical protein
VKILGFILVLGALVAGGILLSDSIPGYLDNRAGSARVGTELEKALAARPTDPDELTRIEQELSSLRHFNDGKKRRLTETGIALGGMIVVGGAGLLLVRRGRRVATPNVAAPLPG